MSGYNYNDQSGCKDCLYRGGYNTLDNVNELPLPQCLQRVKMERSNRDIMDYMVYNLRQPMPNLPTLEEINRQKNNRQ